MRSSLDCAAWYVQELSCRVFMPEYRLTPGNPIPRSHMESSLVQRVLEENGRAHHHYGTVYRLSDRLRVVSGGFGGIVEEAEGIAVFNLRRLYTSLGRGKL